MTSNSPPVLPGRSARWLIIFTTLLAAASRFINLGSLPPQAWVDEIWFALRARELLNGAPWVVHYGISNTAGNAGLVYLTALVRRMGVESLVSARPVAALAGVLTVPLAYACFRELLQPDFARHRRTMAALAALILGGLTFMTILGRVGMEPALLPPVSLAVVWQILVAIRKAAVPRNPWIPAQGVRGTLGSQTSPNRAWIHWAVVGLLTGLAQYDGPHARFLLPLVACLWLESWLAGRAEKMSNVKYQMSNLTVLFLLMLVVALPLILTFIAHPDYLTGRAVSVAEGVSQPENTLTVIAAFSVAGDLNPRQNLPGAPMLDPLLSAGFIVGLLWAARHVRRRLARILLFWLVLMTIPSALTAEAPNFGRMIGAAVPAVALSAIGLTIIYQWLADRVGKMSNVKYQMSNALVLLLIASLSWNIYQVFGLWANHPDLPSAFTSKAVEVGQELVRRANAGTAVYVERREETPDVLAFQYLFDGSPVRRVDFRQCWPFPVDKQVSWYFAFDDSSVGVIGDPVDLDWQGRYLFGRAIRPDMPDINRPTANFDTGLRVNYFRSDLNRGKIIVSLAFTVDSQPTRDWSYFLHIQRSDVDGQPPLAQADGKPCGELYPSNRWQANEEILVVPAMSIRLADLSSGSYNVVFGLYNLTTGERAPLVSADRPLPDNRAILFSFNVP